MAHKNIRDALGDLVPFVQFKNRESTCGEVLLSVKLQAKVCKSITPLWVFFTFFKLTWASHMFVSQTWRPSLILTISGIWNIFSEKETKWKKSKKVLLVVFNNYWSNYSELLQRFGSVSIGIQLLKQIYWRGLKT